MFLTSNKGKTIIQSMKEFWEKIKETERYVSADDYYKKHDEDIKNAHQKAQGKGLLAHIGSNLEELRIEARLTFETTIITPYRLLDLAARTARKILSPKPQQK